MKETKPQCKPHRFPLLKLVSTGQRLAAIITKYFRDAVLTA